MRNPAALTLLQILLLVVLFVLNLLLGTIHIPVGDICSILLGNGGENEIWRNIVINSRVPQALTAMVAGAGLAVSGLQMQTVFRNPLAGPSVLGISNGASLGVAFVVLLSGSLGGVALSRLGYLGDVAMSIAAIIGSLSILSLIAYISQKVRGNVTLLIIGVMIGHLEPNPVLVSLPVSKKAGEDFATIGIEKKYDAPVVLHPGQTVETCPAFIAVFHGDCFSALRNYASLLEAQGVVMPESEPAAFEPAWCAWGYERRFTIDEILGTLPKVKELGFKWATLDDGYQIAEGDWDLTPERFPNGDADMKYMVDEFHKHGLKAELWWTPLAADPGTEFLRK